MNNLKTSPSVISEVTISQILKHAGFRQMETCGRIIIYENWSPLAGANIKIAADDLLGVWYDQHNKKGGTLLELVKHWWHVEGPAAIRKIELLQMEGTKAKRPRIQVAYKIPHYVIEDVRELGTNIVITNFLKESGFFEPAQQSFKELYYYTVDYSGHKKDFCAAACQNAKFGWQVFSKHFNGCIGAESMTIFKNHLRRMAVFENQYKYLLWKKAHGSLNNTELILNSALNIDQAIQAATAYSEIELYFTASPYGFAAAKKFVNALPYSVIHQAN